VSAVEGAAPTIPAGPPAAAPAGARLHAWERTGPLGLPWALIGLLALAALLRFVTLDQQSLWFDEAFTPTHVLHSGLGATLRSMSHTENTPPLFYVLEWGWSRIFDTGAISLRAPSALAGVATVWVAWGIGAALGSRRTAVIAAALVAVNPLFVWYSQEARAYALFALFGGLSFLFFVRARREPGSQRELVGWAISCALALLTHYFAAFLIVPEALGLLILGPPQRARLLAVGAVGVVALALVPLALSQGGHGSQWIGRWALSSRLVAIPQYYALGTSGAPLGHSILLLAWVPVLAALALLPSLGREARAAALVALAIGAAAILAPLVLALGGADYLAPRNLIAAWIPLTAALAVVLGAGSPRVAATALAGIICLIGLGVLGDVIARPRLQRGDWRALASRIGPDLDGRAIVTPELGSAPLEYYRPGLVRIGPRVPLTLTEIDLVGYSPLVRGASRPPVPGFRLVGRVNASGLLVFRFRSATPVGATERQLLARRITRVRSEVLALAAP
jgi:mannosyltransferase